MIKQDRASLRRGLRHLPARRPGHRPDPRHRSTAYAPASRSTAYAPASRSTAYAPASRSTAYAVRTVTLAMLVVVVLGWSAPSARTQEFITTFRGDEVGPRTLDLNEETFLNILSFEQPLEFEQEWLKADSGYRAALGSLTGEDLWLEQELKFESPISDRFRIRTIARQTQDFDSFYTFIQPTLAYQLAPGVEVVSPATLDADKGNMDGGLGLRFEDVEAGLDFAQFVWTRSNVLFNQRSSAFRQSEVLDWGDTIEVQAQGRLGGLGLTSVKLAWQLDQKIRFVELAKTESFRRFSAWLLHRLDISDADRLFIEYQQDGAAEALDPIGLDSAFDTFRGGRDFYRARLEFQHELAPEALRRVRGGVQYLYYREDEDLAESPEESHTILRRESIAYLGYRMPLTASEDVSLESIVFLDWQTNSNRFPNDPGQDGHDPHFQGKLSFLFEWDFADRAQFVLSPSLELDTVGWGGGGIQLRYLF